jgi:hypothetical protein
MFSYPIRLCPGFGEVTAILDLEFLLEQPTEGGCFRDIPILQPAGRDEFHLVPAPLEPQ